MKGNNTNDSVKEYIYRNKKKKPNRKRAAHLTSFVISRHYLIRKDQNAQIIRVNQKSIKP